MDCDYVPKRKSNPRETANVFSFLSFFYTIKLFAKGFRKGLEMDDIYEVLPDCQSKKLGNRLENHWKLEVNRRRNPSLCRALWNCFGKTFILLGLIQFSVKVVTTIWTPKALSKLISYFTPGQTSLTKHDAIFYACLVITLKFLNVFVKNNYSLAVAKLAVRIRAAISSLIFKKSLKLCDESLSQITTGKIITITTKDLEIFEIVVTTGNDIWIAFLQTALICYLIYCKIGIASFAGITLFFVALPLQVLIGIRGYKLKLKCSKKTDERLEFVQEVLSAIKIIKMYTWEKFFETRIDHYRKEEMKQLHKLFYTKMWIFVIGSICSKAAFFIFLMTYIFFDNNVSAEVVYYILSCFNDLQDSLNDTIPFGFSYIAEMFAAIKRIETVIKSKEPLPHQQKNWLEPKIVLNDVAIQIQNKTLLHNISMTISEGLTVVVGPIGSGKTTFLKTFLKESQFSGSVKLFGNVSYASQEPWLFPSTIKNNILFGEKYFAKRYEKVIEICSLTHDLNVFSQGDSSVVGDRGGNLSKGQQARINLARAVYKESDIYLLDDCLASLDTHVSDSIFEECICKFLKNKICVFVTSNSDYIKKAKNVIVIEDGSVKLSEKFITQNIIKNYDIVDVQNDSKTTEKDDGRQINVYHEDKKSGVVPLRDYHRYILHGGGMLLFSFLFLLLMATQSVTSYNEKLLSQWVTLKDNISKYDGNQTNISVMGTLLNEATNILVFYTIAVIVAITLSTISFFAYLFFIRKACISMHKSVVHNIISSTMEFFNSHLIGNILTRFSKDFVTLDEVLPYITYDCFEITFQVCGAMALLTTVHYTFLLETLVLLIFTCCLKQFYQSTGRNLERLHILARGPINGHLSATLEGLITIRAAEAEEIVIEEFHKHQDLYSSVLFMVMTAFRAFTFFLDSVCVIFFGNVIIQFLVTDLDASVGEVGLVLTQALMIANTFTTAIRNVSDCENLMISVERILEFTELKEENKNGQALINWPQKGLIQFDHVSLLYNNKKMLKDITFTVQPKEKMGLVGRTGAGKSSVISALFRLYEVEGKIAIDGVDVNDIPLNLLRSQISVIPQDPYLFLGSIRENLDPLNQYKDEEMWKILEELQLEPFIDSLEQRVDKGCTFSAGQKQLLCLARAILRKSKILVLDEATANVDQETEILMEETIQKHFGECTIIIVAHRLLSVLNCSKVVVLSDGRVNEYDEPKKLLNNKNSFFRSVIK